MFSATLPRVLQRATVATDVMKSLIPSLFHQHRTSVQNKYLLQCRQTPESTEAAVYASAFRAAQRRFPGQCSSAYIVGLSTWTCRICSQLVATMMAYGVRDMKSYQSESQRMARATHPSELHQDGRTQ